MQEFELRLTRFSSLDPVGAVAHGIEPARLNESIDGLRVYFGQRGIWYDAVRTRQLRPPGVTVGVMHTGEHYADDLLPDGIVYHYPVTASPAKDQNEVDATKNAAAMGLPIFVVAKTGSLRDVYLGWVEDWDDSDQTFLIRFGLESLGPATRSEPEEPLVLFEEKPVRREELTRRERDPYATFKVKKKYGNACAVCGISAPGLTDAAHIVPVAAGGVNHPGNGITLCPTHHRLFDADYFTINPYTLEVVTAGELTLDDMRIPFGTIRHLPATPNRSALEWRWDTVFGE
jgi:putative restriction endonuclease